MFHHVVFQGGGIKARVLTLAALNRLDYIVVLLKEPFKNVLAEPP